MIYFTKENKRSRLVSSKISIIVIMIATLMITSTIVTGAFAAPTRKVQGQGTGTLTCGDGTIHTSSILNFDAQPTPKLPGPSHKLFGSLGIVSKIDDSFMRIAGNIYSGKISKADFTLLSTIQGQGLCDKDPSPTKATITGQCGLGVKVNLQFETGAHGTFMGNVVCFG